MARTRYRAAFDRIRLSDLPAGAIRAVWSGDLKVLIVRLDRVPVMDATGLFALESAIATLTRHGCLTILTGLQPQPAQLVARAGFQQRPWRLDVRPDLAAGLAAARETI